MRGDLRLDQRTELGPARFVGGHEAHRDRDPARPGKVLGLDAELRRARADQRLGELEQDAGAVAGRRVGPGRAAMLEIVEGAQRHLDGLVGGLAIEARDRGHPTAVVLGG